VNNTNKTIIIKGIHPVFNCDTFFYISEKNETLKSKIFIFESFTVPSVNSYANENWNKKDIYKGFQAIYGYNQQDIRKELIELLEYEELL